MKSLLVSVGRMVRRDRLYLLISVTGLALGMTVFMLMSAYVRDDLTWDSMHVKGDRIYRVVHPRSFEGMGEFVSVSVPIALGPALKADVPEIVDMTRERRWSRIFMQHGEQPGIYVGNIRFVDDSYFNIFTFPFIYGSPENAFSAKRSIVLEKAIAEQLFGDTNPVGETLQLADTLSYTVAAVVDVPEVGSHIGFNVLMLVDAGAEDFGINLEWRYNNSTTVYVLLAEGADAGEVSGKIKYFMKNYIDNAVVDAASLYLQPLNELHLRSAHIRGPQIHQGDATTTMVFGIIALLVLTLAIINHVNLATARSIRRAREIGIRKAVGANRQQLVRQLIGESMMIVTIAAIVSVGLTLSLQPVFEDVIGRPVTLNLFDGGFFTITLLLLIPAVGFLSGLYPAIIISSLRPVTILGSTGSGFAAKSTLRKILIVFQFTVSVAIVITTTVIYRQMQFGMRMDPGYNREQVWIMALQEPFMQQRAFEIRDRIRTIPGVEAAASCSDYLLGPASSWSMEPEGTGLANWVTTVYSMDPSGIDVFGLKLLQGRFLSADHPGDPIGEQDSLGSIVISEATRKNLGWEDPIGKTFNIWNHYFVTVVGVVDDIRFESAREDVEPIVYLQRTGYYDNGYLAIRLQGGMIHEAIEQVEAMWEAEFPDRPLESYFLDEQVEWLYRSERKLGKTLLAFSVLTFFIAFLGLLGLAVHSTERRSREIAIRKVLGASLANINVLVVSEFARLILIANLIAWPLAWWFTWRWLEGFAYKVGVGLSVFLYVGIGTLLITFVIVALQAWHTVNRNPAEVIREE